MATHNGQPYLEEQLRSLEAQSWPSIDLIVSDDGSTDATLDVVASFASGWKKGRMNIVSGPETGFADNFRSLILNGDVAGDYVAFCDQDDIWKPEKLANAVAMLAREKEGKPALFCGRTELFPCKDKRQMSPLFKKPPSFRNALVQSIAGGNTMVMNRTAFDLLQESVRRTGFVSHDWWTYLLITGCGGWIHYSKEPDILYRQHDLNLVGANNTAFGKIQRIRMLLRGRFRGWTTANLAGLDLCVDLLTPKARQQLATFKEVRQGSLFNRIRALRNSGVYRQTHSGGITLVVACAFGLL